MPKWLITREKKDPIVVTPSTSNSTSNSMSSSSPSTSSSISSPPFPLIALCGIVLFYLYLSTYFPYKEDVQRAFFYVKIALLLLPAVLIFLMRSNWHISIPKPEPGSIHRAGGSPWGVALVVVLLLVMISYHSSVGSHWFRPLWYDHY